jgi:hypothetical protein
MNSPRFKVGDKVIRVGYYTNQIVTIIQIIDHRKELKFFTVLNMPEVTNCLWAYELDNNGKAWDYQLVLAEVYHSPLSLALQENNET